jgi:hypothetical protein
VREVGAPAQLRDLELDDPRARVPLAPTVAIALGHPLLRVALAVGGADQLRDLELHQLLHHQPHRLAQHIRVLVRQHLPGDLLNRHALALGHRGALLCRLRGTSRRSWAPRWPEPLSGVRNHGGRNPASPPPRPSERLKGPSSRSGPTRFRPTASYTTLWDATSASRSPQSPNCSLGARIARRRTTGDLVASAIWTLPDYAGRRRAVLVLEQRDRRVLPTSVRRHLVAGAAPGSRTCGRRFGWPPAG